MHRQFRKKSILPAALFLSLMACSGRLKAQEEVAPQAKMITDSYKELYRPQYHFTPAKNWNNDPNGLVYYKGEYHLFYQYYPGGMMWGPMHWGHAVSTDLLHWKNLPVALYPDSIGYIFSGSAVVDKNNTAGFQKGNEKTLVAIYTQHNARTNVEVQSIAYSNDKGRTWEKYSGNPVIPNPGVRDFRDPNVKWYAPLHEWILVLAAGDHVEFYSSPDLKKWKKESEFGKEAGSHGGVWECPDLFPLKETGTREEKWILMVNNGGSPAGGGGTQYFIGKFDGHTFAAGDHKTRWLDGGADEYAGVTWNNTGNRTLFIGWMNNWPPADKDVLSYTWRGGMTLPMELSLEKLNDSMEFVAKRPAKELVRMAHPVFKGEHIRLSGGSWEKLFPADMLGSSMIRLTANLHQAQKLVLSLQNDSAQQVDIIYDRGLHRLVIDRTRADRNGFHAESAPKHGMEIPDDLSSVELTLFYDHSTVEVFFDNGRWATTDLVFPSTLYNRLKVGMPGGSGEIKSLQVSAIRSIW